MLYMIGFRSGGVYDIGMLVRLVTIQLDSSGRSGET